MNYSNWIIPIGIISFIILISIFYFLYVNRGSEGVLTVSFQVLGAVLAAAALLVIALSKPPEQMYYETNFLMFRNLEGKVLCLKPVIGEVNLSQYHAYSLIDQISIFTEYSPQTEFTDINEEVFSELLIATFMQWLALHYSVHWQMEHCYVAGISGGVGNGTPIDDREREFETYDFSNSSNGFLINIHHFKQIQLPKGSEIGIETVGPGTTIIITNDYLTFTFDVLYLGNGGISFSNLGDMIDSHLQVPGSFYTQNYVISMKAVFHRRYQWSPETNRQRAWMQQVFRNFEQDFSWDSFQPKLQQALEGLPDSVLLHGTTFRIVNTD